MEIEYVVPDLLKFYFPNGCNVTGAISSNVNHTYSVTYQNTEYIVKFMTRKPLDDTEQQRYLKSELIYSKLSEHGVQHIDILYADSIQREFKDIVVYGIFILKKVVGQSLDVVWNDMNTSKKEEFTRNFAQFMKKVHQVEFDKFGGILVKNNQKFDSWVEYVLSKSRNAVNKLSYNSSFNQDLLDNAIKFLKANIENWDYNEVPKLVHADLWSGNILVNGENFTLLDWEWSFAGDPYYDFLWVDEVFEKDQHYVEIFYDEYGVQLNEKNKIKKRCLNVLASLKSCAFGWIHHNPSEEAFTYQQQLIDDNIEGKI